LLDIPVQYYQHRYLRDAYSIFGNGHFVLTEEGAGIPGQQTRTTTTKKPIYSGDPRNSGII